MSAFVCLLRRELHHCFVTPIAYVLLAVFWAANGFFFSFNALFVSAVDMVTAFHNMSLLLMLLMPLITMRSLAEERHSNTLEVLLTLPFSEANIVLAKYAAVLVLVFFMLAGSGLTVLPLALFGAPDYGPIVGGYVGVFMLAAAFAAIGVAASALSANQIVAALLSWALLMLLWFIDYAASLAPLAPLTAWIQHLSFSVQYLDLIRGVIPLGAVAYFMSVVLLGLVAAIQFLRMRRL